MNGGKSIRTSEHWTLVASIGSLGILAFHSWLLRYLTVWLLIIRSTLIDCNLLFAFDSLHCLMTTSALRVADVIRACDTLGCSSGCGSSLRYGFVRTHMCILRVSVKTGGLKDIRLEAKEEKSDKSSKVETKKASVEMNKRQTWVVALTGFPVL